MGEMEYTTEIFYDELSVQLPDWCKIKKPVWEKGSPSLEETTGDRGSLCRNPVQVTDKKGVTTFFPLFPKEGC